MRFLIKKAPPVNAFVNCMFFALMSIISVQCRTTSKSGLWINWRSCVVQRRVRHLIGNFMWSLVLREEKTCICSSKIVYLNSMIYIQLGIIGINGFQGACRNKDIWLFKFLSSESPPDKQNMYYHMVNLLPRFFFFLTMIQQNMDCLCTEN